MCGWAGGYAGCWGPGPAIGRGLGPGAGPGPGWYGGLAPFPFGDGPVGWTRFP